MLLISLVSINAGCFLPWFGKGKNSATAVSVFDKKKYLEVREYEFPEYKWNNNAKFAEEMYAKSMADYFFTGQYGKAAELLLSAKKIYTKDARIYVRLIECNARMEEYQEALDVMREAEQKLRGFSRIEGIEDYREQLTHRIEMVQKTDNQPDRPLWKKILFAPAKLWPF